MEFVGLNAIRARQTEDALSKSRQVAAEAGKRVQETLEALVLDSRAAEAAEATLEHSARTATYTEQLLDAMRESVALSEATRKEAEATRLGNERSAKFTRWNSIMSLAIAVGSLAVAIVALLK